MEAKVELIEQFRVHPKDTGSPEVQIAVSYTHLTLPTILRV